MNQTVETNGWELCKADVFWGEIAPCDHVLQIYETEGVFLDTLSGFVGGGINAGDCCIVIATGAHLTALENRLASYGIHVHDLISENRYIPLNAEETLAKFMVNGWPDADLFNKTITEVIGRNNGSGRRIRAFGEMVAILWAEGNNGATVQLEHLWNKFCEKQSLCLFCAYPKSGFTDDINNSVMHVCNSHSKMITGTQNKLTELTYKALTAV
jgi:hypothetical protein